MENQTAIDTKEWTEPTFLLLDRVSAIGGLKLSNVPLDMVPMAIGIMIRLLQARTTSLPLCISRGEAHVMPPLLQSFLKDNIGSSIHEKTILADLIKRAKSSLQGSIDLRLTEQDVERTIVAMYRSFCYQPSGPDAYRSNEQKFVIWQNEYHSSRSDGAHCLDGQVDWSEDYSSTLKYPPDLKSFRVFLEEMSSAKVEGFSKAFFLNKASMVEKLKNLAVSQVGAEIRCNEALAIIHLARNDRHDVARAFFPLEELTLPQVDKSTTMKLRRAVMLGIPCDLTTGEINQLMHSCKDVPRPNSLPKPEDERICLEGLVSHQSFDAEPHKTPNPKDLSVEKSLQKQSLKIPDKELVSQTTFTQDDGHQQDSGCEQIDTGLQCAVTKLICKLPLKTIQGIDYHNMCIHHVFEVAEEGVDVYLNRIKDLEAKYNALENLINNMVINVENVFALSLDSPLDLSLACQVKHGLERKTTFLNKALETILRAKERQEKRIKALHKDISTRDRKLEENEKDLIRMRDDRGVREEKLSKFIERLESELSTAKARREESHKEMDSLKAQWSKKIQRGHDKIAALEQALSHERDQHGILKLDNGAAVQELKDLRDKLKEAANSKAIERENTNLKKENEGLQASLRSHRTNQRIENDTIKRAVRDAVGPKEAEIKKLLSDRRSDQGNIQELSQIKLDLKRQNEEKGERLIALEEHIAALELNFQAVRKELEEERLEKTTLMEKLLVVQRVVAS